MTLQPCHSATLPLCRPATLQLCHNLTLMLESATDPAELQEQLLATLVDELNFPRAIVGTYDDELKSVTGWLSRGGEGQTSIGHTEIAPVSLDQQNGNGQDPLTQAFSQGRYLHFSEEYAPTTNQKLNQGFGLQECYYIWPMYLRQHPVGVLIVECNLGEELEDEALQTLELVTRHAAVILGSLQLCVERSQESAVIQERNRIAADLHDSVSQSLFGLAYGLDACTAMLPDEPEPVAQVKEQLAQIQPLVYEALSQIRSVILDILPGDLDRDRFINALHKRLSTLTLGRDTDLTVAVTPQFNQWPLEYRQQLMMITHEALANIARHAQAQKVIIELKAWGQTLILTVMDDGVGFEPESAFMVEGLGIDSIRQRIEQLGGVLEIVSMPTKGTSVQAQLPLPRK